MTSDTANEKVLIIEDDPTLLRVLKDNVEFKGYEVETAGDGKKGLEAALDGRPDLMLLDIMLPEINGFEVCRLVREEGLDMPIIMLTAKGEESDVVLGLNLGCDDYVTKPFSIKELLARANAFLRRRREKEPEVYRFGEFELDMRSHRLAKNGEDVELTPKEFGVLEFFVKRARCAVTRDNILKSVWGYGIVVTPRSVDRCVNTLRGKIEEEPGNPRFIKTIREIGYRFEPD